jgi:O-antigen/teichoic acid export membrane protein
MADQTKISPPAPAAQADSAFFRQSGWLMIANIAGGIFAMGVHFLNKWISAGEYSTFVTLLMVTACLPTIPLQMVLAQQSAKAIAENRRGELAGVIRLTFWGVTLVWLIAAVVVFFCQARIVAGWNLPSAMGLWVTLLVVLVSLWMPVFNGALQGKQDFLAMGWAAIGGGFARVAVAALLVLGFKGESAAMLLGAFAGMAILAGVAMWRTRDLWTAKPEPFDKRRLLAQVVPLMFGFTACQFMFTADTMFASALFSREELKPYGAAGTLSRALLWLVLPLAAVMFPKLVHANSKSEKNNLFGLVLGGTGLLTVVGAAGLWLVGPIVVKIIFKEGDVSTVMRLLPWYAFAMAPLAMANVVVNDLMAREKFRVIPWMIALAVAYGFVLPWAVHHWPGRLEVLLQTLGLFNLLLLLVCGVGALRKQN